MPTPSGPRPLRRRAPGPRLGPNFVRLWSAATISTVGDGVSVVAYPWLASQLTRNAAAVALVPVALRLPWLVVSLPAGALVDRVDRRRLMVGVDTIRALVTAGVAVGVLTGAMSLPLLLVLLLVLGTGEVIASNASLALLPAVVEPAGLERANGRLQASDVVGNTLVGPPLAGVLIALALAAPFVADAVSFAASALLVLALQLRPAPAPAAAVSGPPGRHRLRRDIAEGLRWLWTHPTLRLLAITLGAMNGLFAMAISTEVLFAREVLGLGSVGFGLLFSGGAVGGVLGSLVASRVVERIGVGRTLQLSLMSETLSVLLYGLAPAAWVAGLAITLFAVTAIVWNVVTITLRQRLIPDALLGRVGSVYRLLGVGLSPVGAAVGGLVVVAAGHVLGRHLALRTPMLLAGVGYLALLAMALPRMGRLDDDEAMPSATAGP